MDESLSEYKAKVNQLIKFDTIGYWSEIKLEIIANYATAYSRIMSAQRSPSLHHVYVDAFAGAGIHLSKSSGQFVPGSPQNAVQVEPPFRDFYLIDMDQQKVEGLRAMFGSRPNVHVYEGDCNHILLAEVFPKIKYEDYRRGLCILDPYGLDLQWTVLKTAGELKTIDIFLNFPVQDMNRNVLWRNPDRVSQVQIDRMNRFWGDESWRRIAYQTNRNFFELPEKESNDTISEAFRRRLKNIAGFKRVPQPIPMRNSVGAIVYYLFFASQKDTAEHIVNDIFNKFRNREH